ncbi:MAG: 50S ribosomal protein L9 [Acidobacteria bacterium]|nr:MAG: 50S ribosomal protein L9 [Acidobacteriota bacterium]
MEVILKEDVAKLGARGEVVNVAEGYGRNYLLPKKLAVEATSANKAVIEQMKAAAVRKLAKEKCDAELLAKQFEGVSLHVSRKAGENDALFGSVTSADIAHELEGRGFNIDRRKIELEQPIKSLGEFNVPIKLHKEVTVQIKVTVTKQEEATA